MLESHFSGLKLSFYAFSAFLVARNVGSRRKADGWPAPDLFSLPRAASHPEAQRPGPEQSPRESLPSVCIHKRVRETADVLLFLPFFSYAKGFTPKTAWVCASLRRR